MECTECKREIIEEQSPSRPDPLGRDSMLTVWVNFSMHCLKNYTRTIKLSFLYI